MNKRVLFGRKVKRIRESKGWSQDMLSEQSGLHRTYISGIERGIRNPTIDVVFKIAEALNVKPGNLFTEEDNFYV